MVIKWQDLHTLTNLHKDKGTIRFTVDMELNKDYHPDIASAKRWLKAQLDDIAYDNKDKPTVLNIRVIEQTW